MNNFVQRLSNVLAWGGFIYCWTVSFIGFFLGVGKLVTRRKIECSELAATTKDMEKWSNEKLESFLRCTEGHDSTVYEVAFNANNSLGWILMLALLIYIPYIFIVTSNYLLTGDFRLLPWRELRSSQDG